MENLLNSPEHFNAELKALFTSNYLRIKRLLAKEYAKNPNEEMAGKIRELTKDYRIGLSAIEKW